MITEDYVSFEIAKLLKEKGFDEICRAVYVIRDERLVHCTRHNIFDFTNNERIKEVGDGDTAILAPTIQMTMRWLREVHHIHINLDIHWLYFANALGWMYTIEKILENGVDYVSSEGDENDKTFYSTYEEACESAIKYCLKNLI